jgi:hypothetical protein
MRLYQSLKKKIVNVLALMPPNFSLDHFIGEFKSIYSDEWGRLESYHEYYSQKDRTRPGKKFEFPTAGDYLLDCSSPLRRNLRMKHANGDCRSPEEQSTLRIELVTEEGRKRKSRETKIMKRQEAIQLVAPSYFKELEAAYGPSDHVKRLDIVKEMAKYKHQESISFLFGILSGEKDYFIRQEAFFALQRFGNVVFLPSKKMGKKEKQDRLLNQFGGYTDDLGKGPSQVFGELSGDSVQTYKHYDVFLSHSTADHETVLALVTELNANDKVVYVDWISDREDLNRSKANTDTARVLIERMKASKCLILIRTQNSDNSPWIAWEIGFFTSSNSKVCILDAHDGLPPPEFVAMHPKLIRDKDQLVVRTGNQDQLFDDWMLSDIGNICENSNTSDCTSRKA